MTNIERACIANADDADKLIIFCNTIGEWVPSTGSRLDGIAYWCDDWYEDTGEELVGRWCKLWDNFGNCVFTKVTEIKNMLKDK